MTANLRGDYYESVWEAVPEGAEPADLGLRRAFLLEHLHARARARASAAAASADPRNVEPLRVLDVGCGEGQLTAAVAQAGFQVLGLDVAQEPLRRARERHPELELRLVEPEGQWPLPDAGFDVVWAGETIEHVLDTAAWLSQVRRVLAPGGSLLLSTPAHGPLTRLGLGLSARRFERRFDPRGDHLRFYTRRSLARLLEDFRFEQIEIRAAGGLPGARRTMLAAAVRSRF
ncbi:MAG TPA: class I SAM-dependent methyltransferase [Solirubrobacteraceae bacterium]|jgi:2-polyprenyl-3-methyl-5-hydroxy-6-metoxy-1,4-benzoquinol methylase|nr:class I SAM-dependent methyltransferase [Solirubrobacteraceae bacterium]